VHPVHPLATPYGMVQPLCYKMSLEIGRVIPAPLILFIYYAHYCSTVKHTVHIPKILQKY